MTDLVTLAEAQAYLQLDAASADLADLVTNISAQVEAYTGRYFIQRQVTEYQDGGGCDLFLQHSPVVGTPTVTDLETGLPVTGFVSYPQEGILYLPGGWPAGRRRYEVQYVAGYAADTSEVPKDVKQAALEWIYARYYRRDAGLSREALGDYSWSGEAGIPSAVRLVLQRYLVPVAR
ncbi:MAG TPA: hypothetical protein GX511_05915 [Firmicutes bacterium]|nr:hypothetical protein [Bacillota bacterium]